MEVRQLRHFLAVAKWRNFGRAAEKLNITQQALSHSIVQLEKALKVKLLERGQFGAETTEIGKALEQRALLICGELEAAKAEIDALRGGVHGAIRIGIGTMVASGILPTAIVKFSKTHPRIGISATINHSQGLYDALIAGDLDFVVTTPKTNLDNYPDLHHEPIGNALLFNANFLLMRIGHPLANQKTVKLSKVREFPWVLPENHQVFQDTIRDTFHRNDLLMPEYILRTDSLLLVKAVVMQTDFIALVAKESVDHEIAAAVLTGVLMPNLSTPLPSYFSFRRRSPLRPAASALVQCFKNAIADYHR